MSEDEDAERIRRVADALRGLLDYHEIARIIVLALGRDTAFHVLKWMGFIHFTKDDLRRIAAYWGLPEK